MFSAAARAWFARTCRFVRSNKTSLREGQKKVEMAIDPCLRSRGDGKGGVFLHHHGGSAERAAGYERLPVMQVDGLDAQARIDRKPARRNGRSVDLVYLGEGERRTRADGGQPDIHKLDLAVRVVEIVELLVGAVEGMLDCLRVALRQPFRREDDLDLIALPDIAHVAGEIE